MDQYLNFLIVYEKYVLLGLIVLFLLSLGIFIVINMKMGKLLKYYRTMLTNAEGKNLEEILLLCSEKARQAEADVVALSEKVKALHQQVQVCTQKVSIVRFNAFEDVGGELSFSMALLDDCDNGFVLSNIYARQESHVYIRPVERGKAKIYLLPEEEQALGEAKKKGLLK